MSFKINRKKNYKYNFNGKAQITENEKEKLLITIYTTVLKI